MKSLFLHIGIAKAGSTTIQTFLAENRALLLNHGCLYPRIFGPGTQVKLAQFASRSFFDMPRRMRSSRLPLSHKDFTEAVERKLLMQVAQHDGPSVVLSSEHLSSNLHTAEELNALGTLLRRFANHIKIIIYVRRQDELLVSRHEQSVKAGNSAPIRLPLQGKSDHLYDYRVLTSLWAAEFGQANIIVRPLERQRFADGRLEWDFLNCLGIIDRAGFALVADQNRSMGAEAVEFLRRLNPHLESRRLQISVMRALSSQPKGQGVVMDPQKLRAFYKRFEDSNEFVARHYMGNDGKLFERGPPEDGDATKVQSAGLDLNSAIKLAGAVISNLQFDEAAQGRQARLRKLKAKKDAEK